MNPLVIIHGWSDDSKSFRPLATALSQALARPAKIVNLADYISMDDDVTFDDLNAAMEAAWTREKLLRTFRSVDVVVHSTGGLVIRNWLQTYFEPSKTPVYQLLMLAPANFGSPLAHKGSSMIGRIVKGWTSEKRFEVGEKLLKGFELASTFQWELALKDRFAGRNFYDKEATLCTVMVGNSGYSGIASAANEEGSDGTVRASTANLNCARLNADFESDPTKPKFKLQQSDGRCGFRVFDGINHATIRQVGAGSAEFGEMVKALSVDDATFGGWCEECDAKTAAVMRAAEKDSYRHGFQNTVYHVADNFGADVQDYFIEFFDEDGEASIFEDVFHRQLIRTTHCFGPNKSYRSMLVDVTLLSAELEKLTKKKKLCVSLSAAPDIRSSGNVVGYDAFSDKSPIGSIKLTRDQIPSLFQANRTILVDIKLKRYQTDRVFTIKPMG